MTDVMEDTIAKDFHIWAEEMVGTKTPEVPP
jgi:hypothetical protein